MSNLKLKMGKVKKQYLILALILFAIFIFRFPGLFEPFWYGDEGIFAAVASNLTHGGILYQTAWDNKPPMIYLTYAAIFKTLGVSMFNLRLVTMIWVLATACAIYEIAQATIGTRRALAATFIFGFLSSLRLIEGNLALTEIYMILPITLAMLVAVKRKFDLPSLFVAGILFAIASLYKQVGALETAALGIFLFLYSKNIGEFLKKGIALGVGFLIPYFVTIGYFASKGLLSDYIFAAYTYYRIYFGESPKYSFLINILKFMPLLLAAGYGLFKKFKKDVGVFHLFLLWAGFSFLGSFFSGRTYGHYLVQSIPSVSLILASFSFGTKIKRAQIAFGLPFLVAVILLVKLLFSNFILGSANQIGYYSNFLQFAYGGKTLNSYNNYFDRNVNTIMALSDFLKVAGGKGQAVYIWGDYPWLYAISDLKNPVRYVTSFHVFGVPGGKEEVAKALAAHPPKYIIKSASSTGYFAQLEKLLWERYTYLFKVETADVYLRAD